MRNAAAKLTFITLNVTFINKSHAIVISQEDELFKAIAKPKVIVQLRWSNLFSKSSWIKTTASGLSYKIGVNGEKKLMETGIFLIKMDIVHFTLVNSKLGNFNNLRVVIIFELYYDTVTLKLTEDEFDCQKKVLWLLSSFR